MKDLLNATVKFREPFRPYAPSVLEESCGKYFGSPVPSPYMLRAYPTRPEFDRRPAGHHPRRRHRPRADRER